MPREADLEAFAAFGGTAVFFLVLWAAYRASARKRERALAVARKLITGGVETDGKIRGHLNGREVDFRLTGVGEETKRTEVQVALADLELVWNILPQTATATIFARTGLAVDVAFGDREFDAAFLVEAAPEAVVREVFGAPTRARMVRLSPLEVTTKQGRLLVAKNGWFAEPRKVEEAIELAVNLAERIESAFDKMASQAAGAAGGYRVSADAAEKKAVQSAAREVAAVRDTQERRDVAKRKWSWRLFVVYLAVVALVVGLVAYLELR